MAEDNKIPSLCIEPLPRIGECVRRSDELIRRLADPAWLAERDRTDRKAAWMLAVSKRKDRMTAKERQLVEQFERDGVRFQTHQWHLRPDLVEIILKYSK